MTKIDSYLNRLNLNTKLLFLVLILAFTFISGSVMLYIFSDRVKQATNNFYDRHTLLVTHLNEIKDIYSINVLDTVDMLKKDIISHEDGIEILNIAVKLVEKEWGTYSQKSIKDDYFINNKDYISKTEETLLSLNRIIKNLTIYLKSSGPQELRMEKWEETFFLPKTTSWKDVEQPRKKKKWILLARKKGELGPF